MKLVSLIDPAAAADVVLLAGRATPQVVNGGTAAGQQLTLRGNAVDADGGTVRCPGTLSAPVVQSGDLHLRSEDGSMHWILREGPGRIEASDQITGRTYELALRRVGLVRRAWRGLMATVGGLP